MVGVRLEPDFRAEIETWAEEQEDKPVLAEAIRRLIRRGLGKPRKAPAAPAHASKLSPTTKPRRPAKRKEKP